MEFKHEYLKNRDGARKLLNFYEYALENPHCLKRCDSSLYMFYMIQEILFFDDQNYFKEPYTRYYYKKEGKSTIRFCTELIDRAFDLYKGILKNGS